jgi:hypothetical protein
MSTFGDHPHTVLTTIPPTPAVGGEGDLLSPFKESDDYFAIEEMKKGNKSSASDVLMQMYVLIPEWCVGEDANDL